MTICMQSSSGVCLLCHVSSMEVRFCAVYLLCFGTCSIWSGCCTCALCADLWFPVDIVLPDKRHSEGWQPSELFECFTSHVGSCACWLQYRAAMLELQPRAAYSHNSDRFNLCKGLMCICYLPILLPAAEGLSRWFCCSLRLHVHACIWCKRLV